MDKDLLNREILLSSGVEVGLSWKYIYIGVRGPMEENEKVKSLYVEINEIHNQQKFTILSNKYGRLETGFPGVQKMWLFLVKNKTKSDHSNKKLMKDVLCQKSFLEVIKSNTNADILTLDKNTWLLDYLRMIISKLTPNKYPNLPIFLSVDKLFWSL